MILDGNPAASPPVWVSWRGKRLPIAFPVGYFAEFTPLLVVKDASGRSVAFQGDDVSTDQFRWPGLVICTSDVRVDVFDVAYRAPG